MAQDIQVHQFENGLTLLAESMPWLESAAFAISLPGGAQRDPADRMGLANFSCEMVQRGCGPRDSRQFVNDLENMGVVFSGMASNSNANYGGAMPADKLHEVLPIFADLVRRPHLPADKLEEGRLVCLQEIRSLEDDLAQRVMSQLLVRRYPAPHGRHPYGESDDVGQITIDDIGDFVRRYYSPTNALLSVAGKLDWDRLRDQVAELFSDWEPQTLPELVETEPDGGYLHLPDDSSQTHIGLAYPTAPLDHPDYYRARGVVGVLSDGMSSRLFTEVREKRGLCYSVYASYHSLRSQGAVLCYAGTTTQRAQETLDVMLQELSRIELGVEANELQRLQARFKSRLIMQQESSSARASMMISDWRLMGRIRSLDEMRSSIDALTLDAMNDYIRQHPPSEFNYVSLGADPLEISGGVS